MIGANALNPSLVRLVAAVAACCLKVNVLCDRHPQRESKVG